MTSLARRLVLVCWALLVGQWNMRACHGKKPKPVISSMNTWTKIATRCLTFDLQRTPSVRPSEIKDPPGPGKYQINRVMVGDVAFENVKTDATFGNVEWQFMFILRALKHCFGVRDVIQELSDDDVPRLLKETGLGAFLKPIVVHIEDPASDEALIQQAFFGLGSHMVEEVLPGEFDVPEGAVFKVDTMILQNFEVRKGFERYGAACYFDKDCKPLAIRTAMSRGLVYPHEQLKWQHAKYAWRSSVVAKVTVVDHLFNLHFNTASHMLRSSREALGKNHVIKRALGPFLLRTSYINNRAAYGLLERRSVLEHTFTFTRQSFIDCARDTYQQGEEWVGIRERYSKMGDSVKELIADGGLPFYEDGLELYDCYRTFYERCLADMTSTSIERDEELQTFWKKLGTYTNAIGMGIWKPLSKDALVNVLATFAFHVTAGHDLVGTIGASIETPLHGGPRIRPGQTRLDMQGFIGDMQILTMTSINTPEVMSNFTDYWNRGRPHLRHAWHAMQEDMKELTEKIDARQRIRRYPFIHCNPKYLECAVSV